jgi:hypothetical protein
MASCPYCSSKKVKAIKSARFANYFNCKDCDSFFQLDLFRFTKSINFNFLARREKAKVNHRSLPLVYFDRFWHHLESKQKDISQFKIDLEIKQSRIWEIVFFSLAFFAIAVIRLRFCISLPIQTGDITRHLYYGLLINQKGLEAAGYPLTHFGEAYKNVAWSFLPYSYPALALYFFGLVAKIYPSIFVAKLLLTLIEAVNALQIYIYSRERILSLIYWASPLSIWWVSGEAQFEPLQSLFLLLALCLKSNSRYFSFLCLALAVQVKISAILLIPYFLIDTWIYEPQKLIGSIQAFFIGLVPTLFAQLYFPALQQVILYSSPLDYNPYIWNFSPDKTHWNPAWMVVANGIFTYGVIFLILQFALKNERVKLLIKNQKLMMAARVSIIGIAPFIAPFLFVVACKILKNVQFWYFTLFLSFILPVKNRFQRYCFFIFHPLLDLYGAIQVFAGPLYVNISDYYLGISVFQELHLLAT